MATQPPNAVSVPETTIDDQVAGEEIASLSTLAAGEQAVDKSGNLVTVHGLRRLPMSLGQDETFDLAAFDLFADTESLLATTNELVMLDVAMCAAGNFSPNPSGSVEFLATGSADAVLNEAVNLYTNHALLAPGFAFPETGACSRGWVPVDIAESAGSGLVARYVLTVAGSDGSSQKHVYQWPVEASSADETQPVGFRQGELVTFNQGPLAGTTVTLHGWTELFDAAAPAGTRLVGTFLTVCPASEDWPELGISIDGWNLIGPVDGADRLGADPLAPQSGSCFEDWAEFAVPLGAAPTGFFVSDGRDPIDGFAQWTLDGAAIDGPT